MAAFPQPTIHIHSAPQLPQLHSGPFIRNNHHPFPVQYPPSYFPIPTGWDPSVSLAHPYIYDPTQVKHRRRTTPEQLKILEDTFKTDPKPNAALRKQLSLEIGMTPRVLQVWFQNRRMKVKREAKKLKMAASCRNSPEPERGPNSGPTDLSTPPAPQTPPTNDSHDSPHSPPVSTASRSSTPSTEGNLGLAPPQLPDGVRRGSLPAALEPAHNAPQTRHNGNLFKSVPDPAIPRRRSMTSLQRLDAHPYGPVVAASNGPTPAHTVVPPTHLSFPPPRPSFLFHHHSPSTPTNATPVRLQQNRAASFHVIPTPQHLRTFYPHTTAQPYAFPPRPLQPPIPGPLPAADYSFGTPPAQHAAQEEIDVRPYVPPIGAEAFSVRVAAAAAAGVAVPRFLRRGDDDTDTEHSSSRFGSIASDTSASPSASVSGASTWGDTERRGSCTGHVAEMLSGLDVGSRKADESLWSDQWTRGGSTDNLAYPQDTLDQENQVPYSDPGGAYGAQEDSKYEEGGPYPTAAQDTQSVPISTTSELTYALCRGGAGGNNGQCGDGGNGGKEEVKHTLTGYSEHPLRTLPDGVAYKF